MKPTTDKGKAEGWMCIGSSSTSSSVLGELNNPYCNLHQTGIDEFTDIVNAYKQLHNLIARTNRFTIVSLVV